MENNLEVWMRGPIPGVPALLQPVAHALLQVQEEIKLILEQFPDNKLWISPMGMASVGFHVQHICGVVDRMLTYALQQPLSQEQFAYLEKEGKAQDSITANNLLKQLDLQITRALNQLSMTSENELKKPRSIGRKKIPTTLIGLLFHAAEHSQRHLGQLLVTSKIV